MPVLRNRRSVLFFMESPFDEFGPSTVEYDALITDVRAVYEFAYRNGCIGVTDVVTNPVWTIPSRHIPVLT